MKFFALRIFLIAVVLNAGPVSAGIFTEVSPQRKRMGNCAAALLAPVVLYAFGAWMLPTVTHDARAHLQGKEHLAYGIYLDMPRIRSVLNEQERALLENPQANADAIAKLFTIKLSGDYDFAVASDHAGKNSGDIYWPAARDASTYLRGQNAGCARGICRHKAVVLHGILKALGIESQLYHAQVTSTAKKHVWVQIGDQVYDPTEARSLPQQRYIQFLERVHGYSGVEPQEFSVPYFVRGYMY